MLKIYPLSEKKVIYPVLAYWSYNNWYLHRDVPFKFVLEDYKRRSEPGSLPFSYVAFWGELPVGMVSVKEIDMLSRQEISPWLSALYVSPEYRGRGIGTELINSAFILSTDMGYDRIFLFIDSRYMDTLEKFYENNGWIYYDEDIDSDGNMTKILFHDL